MPGLSLFIPPWHFQAVAAAADIMENMEVKHKISNRLHHKRNVLTPESKKVKIPIQKTPSLPRQPWWVRTLTGPQRKRRMFVCKGVQLSPSISLALTTASPCPAVKSWSGWLDYWEKGSRSVHHCEAPQLVNAIRRGRQRFPACLAEVTYFHLLEARPTWEHLKWLPARRYTKVLILCMKGSLVSGCNRWKGK